MAYVFDKISQALGDDQKKQDVFGGQQPLGGEQPADGGAAPGGEPQVKTSTEGADVGGGAGGGSTQGGENIPQEAAKQDAAVVRRNIGKVAKPAFADRIGGELRGAEESLQSEANKYVQTAQEANKSLGDDVYGKAVSGDKEAQGQISGLLGRSAEAESKAYGEFKPETQTDVSDVEALRSGAGIGELLRKEAGPSLTAREIALDRSILERSPEFIKIKNALIGQQAALRDKASGLRESETAKAREAVAKGLTSAQEGARGGLGVQESAIRSEIERRAAEENAAREALRSSGGGEFASSQSAAAQAELAKSLTDPQGAAKYLQQALQGFDPNQFYSVSGNVGAADLTSQEEASKFNLINQLLGRGDIVQAGSGPGSRESFNQQAYMDALRGRAEGFDKTANEKAQAQLDAIIADAQKRAGQQNAALAEMRGGKIGDDVLGGRYAIDAAMKQRFGDTAWNRVAGQVDPKQFAKIAQDYDWKQMLANDQASEANKALEELSRGGEPRFSAGGPLGPRGTFDAGAYQAALEKLLNVPEDPEMRTRDKLASGAKQASNAIDQMGRSLDKATGGNVASVKRNW